MAETRILIVEDEIIIAEEIQECLKSLGYSVTGIALSGEEAIRKATEDHPDLILMDIMLKGNIDGIQAAESICNLFDVAIIYLTAYSDDKTLERAKVTEPSGYILKPFEKSELHIAIEVALHKHKMDRKIKESEQWYSTTLRSIGDAVITTDENGVVTFMNPVAEKLTGWIQESAIGKQLQEVYVIPNKTSGVTAEHPQRMFSGVSHDKILVAKDGTEKPVRESGAPIKDTRGRIMGTITVFQDITDHKKLEQQLLQAQKMEAIGQLAGGVAHDFNNVLTAIIGYGRLLLDMETDDQSNKFIRQILLSAERAAKLTRSLLTFSRKQIINPISVNLNQIIKGIENLLHRLIGEDIELSIVLPEEDLKIVADAIQIEQVLMNLATNARDAMPDGGSLVITMESVRFDHEFVKAHGYGRVGRYACISVADTGEGMDERTKARIFEPFFTTKGVGKGTGLGLAMVYGTIQQHEGYISVYSEPGKGTTFKIFLPLIQLPVEEETKPPLQMVRSGTETVLIAEDDAQVRCLMKEVLTGYGYTVFEAVDGEDAVRVFRENKDSLQLVILDVVMPKINGKEVYEEIKKVRPDIRALFTSGYDANIIHKRGVLKEGLHFISKPILPEELLWRMRDILDDVIEPHQRIEGG